MFAGIRTNDQMSDSSSSCSSSDDGVNIRTMVSGFMSKPETIIFAVEAASCEDFATSHIAPLIKYALVLCALAWTKRIYTTHLYNCSIYHTYILYILT